MLRGSINHLDLTVSDLAASEPFYDSVLGYLGFQRLEPPPGTAAGRPVWHATDQHLFSIALCQARPGSGAHDRFTPGLHHLAFQAESRDDVDRCHRFLLETGVTILDPPADYPGYGPVYYAVFFADPDGRSSSSSTWPEPRVRPGHACSTRGTPASGRSRAARTAC